MGKLWNLCLCPKRYSPLYHLSGHVHGAITAFIENVSRQVSESICGYPQVEHVLLALARRLGEGKGKRSCGYIPKPVKKQMDEIVEQMERLTKGRQTDRMQQADRSGQSIALGSCAPVPIWDLEPLLRELYGGAMLSSGLSDLDEALGASAPTPHRHGPHFPREIKES